MASTNWLTDFEEMKENADLFGGQRAIEHAFGPGSYETLIRDPQRIDRLLASHRREIEKTDALRKRLANQPRATRTREADKQSIRDNDARESQRKLRAEWQALWALKEAIENGETGTSP